jgi:flagellar biosynthesis protein FlhG
MAVGMALLRQKVVAIDADLGGANLHTVFGMERPARTLADFFEGRVSELGHVLLEHPHIEDLRIACGAPGAYGQANVHHQQKAKFLRHMHRLDADYVILDLGAGTHYNTLDLFLSADLEVVLVTPDPLSLLDGFGFVKQALYRRLALALHAHPQAKELVQAGAKSETFHDSTVDALLDTIRLADPEAVEKVQDILDRFQPALMINKVQSGDDETEGLAVKVASQDLLSVRMDYLGHVHYDDAVSEAIKNTLPFLKYDPKAQASRDLAEIIISRILYRRKFQAMLDKNAVQKRLKEKWEMRKEAVICSVQCLYWEECQYRQGGYPCKMQHLIHLGHFQK